MRMKWNFVFSCIAMAFLVATSGCVSSVDNRYHAGMPFVADQVTGRYERPVLDVWTAAKDVLNYNGKVYSEDVMKSTLEASVNQRTVWVRVEPVDPKITKVTVQARTKMGADVGLASEMDKQIALRLATGNLTPAATGASK